MDKDRKPGAPLTNLPSSEEKPVGDRTKARLPLIQLVGQAAKILVQGRTKSAEQILRKLDNQNMGFTTMTQLQDAFGDGVTTSILELMAEHGSDFDIDRIPLSAELTRHLDKVIKEGGTDRRRPKH